MITFVRRPSWWGRRAAHPENVMAPLDIGYAVALLSRAGVKVELLDVEASGATPEEVIRSLRRRPPVQVVLQMITPAVPRAEGLARAIKDSLPSVKQIIAVGQHATALPETLLGTDSPFDLCIRGEFEEKILELVTSSSPDPSGLARRGPGGELELDPTILAVEELDALPLPAHHLFISPRYRVFHPTGVKARWRWGFLLSSRGCPYPCIYCSPTLRNSHTDRCRVRSTDSVLEELQHLSALGCTLMHFKDDVFTLNRARVVELCEAILGLGLKINWTVQTRPDLVDAGLLRLMKRAGCVTVGLGVESGSQRVLDRLRKQLQVEDVRRAFALAREAGLLTVGFFMLGNPGETEQDIQQTHRLLLEVAPDIIQVAFFTAYPGAAVFNSELLDKFTMEDFSHYNVPMNYSEISDQRLGWWQRKLYLDFILRTGFIPRYLRHQTLPSLINPEKFAELARLSVRFLGRRLLS